MPGEAVRVDGRRRDHDLEVGPAWEQLPDVPENEVDVEAALVRLVDDQGVVAAQHPVLADLGQEDAVGHEFHQRPLAHLGGEPDLVADAVPQPLADLLRDPLRDRARGEPARLGVADQPPDAAAQLQADLGELGGLARAGLPRDDHHLVVADGRSDVLDPRGDRQLVGVADLRYGGAPRGDPLLGGLDLGDQPGGVTRPVEQPPQPVLVAQRQAGQALAQPVPLGYPRRRCHVSGKDMQPRRGRPLITRACRFSAAGPAGWTRRRGWPARRRSAGWCAGSRPPASWRRRCPATSRPATAAR